MRWKLGKSRKAGKTGELDFNVQSVNDLKRTVSVSQLFPIIATEYCFWGNDFLSEQILPSLDKNDHDCGTGGGRNNAEVFYLAGLTVLTNADDSQQDGM